MGENPPIGTERSNTGGLDIDEGQVFGRGENFPAFY